MLKHFVIFCVLAIFLYRPKNTTFWPIPNMVVLSLFCLSKFDTSKITSSVFSWVLNVQMCPPVSFLGKIID